MRIPKLRRHVSGRAFVEIGGKRHYLGKHGSKESKDRYRRLIGQWINPDKPRVAVASAAGGQLLIKELILAYWEQHASKHYTKHGRPTSALANIRTVCRKHLRPLCGDQPAASFGVLELEEFRDELLAVRPKLARKTVNDYVDIVRRMFRWGARKRLIPVATWREQKVLEGLGIGRGGRESNPIAPVPQAILDATLAQLSDVVAAMVRFQMATGCRPGEACSLRPCDVDRSEDIWRFVPCEHKTEHKGRRRVIYIGAVGQDVLRPFLLRPASAYCFSPEEAAAAWNKKPGSRRPKGACFTVNSYRRAIHRACDRADKAAHIEQPEIDADVRIVPRWSPNRLRHNAATEIRKRFGLEASQCVLGHASAKITEVYAERDEEIARRVMREMG